MSSVQLVRTVFEMIFVGFTVWAVFHEDLFVVLEERLFSYIKRRRLKVVSSSPRTVK